MRLSRLFSLEQRGRRILSNRSALLAIAGLLCLVGAWVAYLRLGGGMRKVESSAVGLENLTIPSMPVGIEGSVARAPAHDIATRSADPQPVRGRVLDGRSSQPLPGALVRTYRARKGRWHQGLECERQFVWQEDGRTHYLAAPWPLESIDASGEARLGLLDTLIYDAPQSGDLECDETTSDKGGFFALALPPEGGVILATHPLFSPKMLPVPVANAEDPIHLTMWPGHELSGQLIRRNGSSLSDEVRLLFCGTGREGVWSTKTSPTGCFRVTLGAPAVVPKIIASSWVLEWPVGEIHENDSFVSLVARAVPLVRVVDADTGDVVRDFTLLCRDDQTGGLLMTGSFRTQDGTLPLVNDLANEAYMHRSFTIVVWALGYQAATRQVPDLLSEQLVSIALEKGQTPSVTGKVTGPGESQFRARMSLLALSGNSNPWTPDNLFLVDSDATEDDGTFSLTAAPGEYIVRVQADDIDHTLSVSIPGQGDLAIDLRQLATLVVGVHDAQGLPVEGESLSLEALDHRTWTVITDNQGLAIFRGIAPEKVTVVGPKRTQRDVTLRPGDTQFLEWSTSGGEEGDHPIRAWLIVEGAPCCQGWRIKKLDERDWLRPGDDGSCVLDGVARASYWLVESPSGMRWRVLIPANPPQDYRISISINGAGYEGILIDPRGHVLTGVRVTATPVGQADSPAISAMTDHAGIFRITGLSEIPHALTFEGGPIWLTGVTFLPSNPASSPTRFIRVQLPRLWEVPPDGRPGEKRIVGQVKRQNTGIAVPGAWVCVSAVLQDCDGKFYAESPGGVVVTNDRGEYHVTVHRAPKYVVAVYRDVRRPDERVTFEWEDDDGLSARDLEIP